MVARFYKYQGAGNDFIILDGMKERVSLTEDLIRRLCDRKFGIGADGLMEIVHGSGLDFRMVYYNADGREASLCGNGGRCIVAYASRAGYISASTTFGAVDGQHQAVLLSPSSVRLKLNDTRFPVPASTGLFINTGSPHMVIFRKEVDTIDVFSEGRKHRYSDEFAPDGTNVNFVERTGTGAIRVRTYERGVENETLSCGTGVVASAICTAFVARDEVNTYHVSTRGGNLLVTFKPDNNAFTNIWIEGPATFVFTGEIEL